MCHEGEVGDSVGGATVGEGEITVTGTHSEGGWGWGRNRGESVEKIPETAGAFRRSKSFLLTFALPFSSLFFFICLLSYERSVSPTVESQKMFHFSTLFCSGEKAIMILRVQVNKQIVTRRRVRCCESPAIGTTNTRSSGDDDLVRQVQGTQDNKHQTQGTDVDQTKQVQRHTLIVRSVDKDVVKQNMAPAMYNWYSWW